MLLAQNFNPDFFEQSGTKTADTLKQRFSDGTRFSRPTIIPKAQQGNYTETRKV